MRAAPCGMCSSVRGSPSLQPLLSIAPLRLSRSSPALASHTSRKMMNARAARTPGRCRSQDSRCSSPHCRRRRRCYDPASGSSIHGSSRAPCCRPVGMPRHANGFRPRVAVVRQMTASVGRGGSWELRARARSPSNVEHKPRPDAIERAQRAVASSAVCCMRCHAAGERRVRREGWRAWGGRRVRGGRASVSPRQ